MQTAQDRFTVRVLFLPERGPQAGWCTWPDVHASPHQGSESSGKFSPGPPAAGR